MRGNGLNVALWMDYVSAVRSMRDLEASARNKWCRSIFKRALNSTKTAETAQQVCYFWRTFEREEATTIAERTECEARLRQALMGRLRTATGTASPSSKSKGKDQSRVTDKRKRAGEGGEKREKLPNVFISGLANSATESDVADHISKTAGFATTSVRVLKHARTGKSRCLGYADFAPDVDLDAVVAAVDGTTLKGRRIYVQRSDPQGHRAKRLRDKVDESCARAAKQQEKALKAKARPA